MTNEMRPYGDYNGISGITGFAIDPDDNYMEIEYASGGVYTYSKANVGEVNFAVMKALAISGSGLNSYINKNVRGRGVRRFSEPAYSRTFTITTSSPKDVEVLSEVLTAIGVAFSVS